LAWYLWIILLLFLLYVFNLIIILILENREPHKTIAWILVLLFLPGIGLIIYLWVGESLRIKFRDWRLRRPKYAKTMSKIVNAQKQFLNNDRLPNYLDNKKHIIYLALQSANFPFSKNNSVKILNNGNEFFPELFKEIENAKEHIHLEYYIFRNDKFTDNFIKLLIKKAKEGVKVRILCDGLGSHKFVKQYKKKLAKNKINLGVFLPIKLTFFKSKLNHRNHRKITVIDGKIGFIGGMNIGQEYLDGGDRGFWRDSQFKIEGPAVYSLQNIFVRDWFFATKKGIYDTKLYPKMEIKNNINLLVVPSGPNLKWDNSRLMLFSLITNAEKRLYIETPYFAPDESILMALKSAALKGVDVALIIPDAPDLPLYRYVNFSYLPGVLNAGVKVYAYKSRERGVLHTKMLVSDDISTIGSTNLNSRSLKLDFEANVYVFNCNITQKVVDTFKADLKDCIKITKETLENQSRIEKFKQSLARLLSPLM